MAYWSMNNRASKTTWSTLRILNQLDAVFADAGVLCMKELTFYNQTSSDDQRRSIARMIAIQLDNIFRDIRSARYETGVTGDQAIEALAGVLATADATVADLAEESDRKYQFYGEEDA